MRQKQHIEHHSRIRGLMLLISCLIYLTFSLPTKQTVYAGQNNTNSNAELLDEEKQDDQILWEQSYSTAKKTAERTHKPLMVVMSAQWCGPCKDLDKNTFTDPLIIEILKPFVVVKTNEDKVAENELGLNGYPTIVFLDANQKAVHRTLGYYSPGLFFKEVMRAYELCGLEIPEAWKELASRVVQPDWTMAQYLAEQGKVKELQEMLKAVENDPLSNDHYLIVQIEGKLNISKNPLDVFWNYKYLTVPDSKVLLLWTDDKTGFLNITYPGYEQIIDRPSFDTSKVLTRTYQLKRLSEKLGYSLKGKVLLPDGKPAIGAIVRVYDWTTTKTDRQGHFEVHPISKGEFTVRAEYPGCDIVKKIKIDSTSEKIELLLKPATTMHFRFTYQNLPEMTSFTKGELSHGEAIISEDSSRFSLRRQHPMNNWGSDFMLDLKDGQLIFWLFDATTHNNGLLKVNKQYSQVAQADPVAKYEFLRGVHVREGDVYIVKSCQGEHYAKMEILGVHKPYTKLE